MRSTLRRVAREWLIGLTCFSLVIAPMGCTVTIPPLEEPSDDALPTQGMILNESSGEVLLAGKSPSGGAYFVYGSRDGSGGIAEVDAILAQDADGKESYIVFESGRPTYVRGPDGSYANVTYTSLSMDRLAVSAEVYDAGANQKTVYEMDVNPLESLEEVAQLVADTTGQPIETPQVSDASAKTSTYATKITIFSPLFTLLVAPFLVLWGFTTILLGQILAAIYAVVIFATKALLLTIFAPLYLIAALLDDTIINISLAPLTAVFAVLPPKPGVIIVGT